MSYPSPAAEIAAASRAGLTRWRWQQRLVAVVVGGTLMALVATAASLKPSSAGLGTHQQLGLPPCTVLDWFGVRCPSCGMTTSWAHITRGQVPAALRANAGGAMLALIAATCGPWLTGSGLAGRWLVRRPHELVVLATALTVIVVTLAQWTARLLFGW